MELIEDEDKDEGALPEPEPRHKAELPEGGSDRGQVWPRILAGALAAIIIIFLLVILARWIYHEVNHNNPAPAASNSKKQPAASPNNQPGAGSAPGAPGGSNNQSSAANTNKSATASNGQITNTGPGNVVAIFVGASLAAAGLHYIISLRRFNRGHRT